MRARNQALVDGVLYVDIGVAGTFRAEIAQRGEAGHQGVVYVLHGFDGAIGQRFLQNLIVPQGFVVRMEENMRVRVDQAR